MTLAIIITSAEAEAMNNAFRLGNFAQTAGDHVTVFLLGAGVEIGSVGNETYNVREKAGSFLHAGGDILACGTCLEQRGLGLSDLYTVSNLKALRDLIAASEKVVTF